MIPTVLHKEQSGSRACKGRPPGPMQTLQPKACVACGATKTPLWRCNVDGVKSLCNRCGVRLYREQKKAHHTEERLSLNDDDKDDSLSCTCSASYTTFTDSQPAPAKRKSRTAQQVHSDAPGQEDELVCWTGMNVEASVDVQSATGPVKQPVLLNDNSNPVKRMRSSELSPYSSGSDDDLVLMDPAIQSATPIIIQAQQALKQAWPSLAKGPLGHLWEAGLDPLDPMFLANINDPIVSLASEDAQSEIGLLLGSFTSSLAAEHISFIF